MDMLTDSRHHANGEALEREIDWFSTVLEARLNLHFGLESAVADVREISPPELPDGSSDLARVVKDFNMSFDERLILALAMIPQLRPEVLDTLLAVNKNTGFRFTEFGGYAEKSGPGFLPTCETASFLLHGSRLSERIAFMKLLRDDHFLLEQGVIQLERPVGSEGMFQSVLKISSDWLSRITLGKSTHPDFSGSFPAKRITTRLTWDDLVLPADTRDEVESNILAWIRHGVTIMQEWGLERVVKPGYRCLFYGPPGTGKTLTATLIGKTFGLDVYRIDLSMVVSKYIGETEKLLASIFDQAKSKNWILFFDEADALFGKRTQTSSSNDRYANQEVSYLLQRVEDFPGVVILATNLKANIDEAFLRRFQASIYFPLPDAEHRFKLWEGYFRGGVPCDSSVDLRRLAEDYEVSGGSIANVVRFAAMRALESGRREIAFDDLIKGIAKEMIKEGKTI